MDEFSSGFLTSHVTSHCLENWYEGISLIESSTNNALEAWNKVIKDEHTLRERLPFANFLKTNQEYLSSWSNQYLSGMKIFTNEPGIVVKLWTKSCL